MLDHITPEQEEVIRNTLLMITEAVSLSREEKISLLREFANALVDGTSGEFVPKLWDKMQEQEPPALDREEEELTKKIQETEFALDQSIEEIEKLPAKVQEEASELLNEAMKQAEGEKKTAEASQIDDLRNLIRNKK